MVDIDLFEAYIGITIGRHYNPDNPNCPNNGKEKGKPGWLNCIECEYYKKCWLDD